MCFWLYKISLLRRHLLFTEIKAWGSSVVILSYNFKKMVYIFFKSWQFTYRHDDKSIYFRISPAVSHTVLLGT
jgi:hypothetical protein